MSNQAIFNMIDKIRTRAIEDLYDGNFNYESTMPLLLRQLDILKEIGDLAEIGVLYRTLAIIELELGNFTRSLEYYQASLEAFEDAGQPIKYATTLCGLGELYRETGEVEKAADCYQRSRQIAEQENDARIIIYNYANEGQLWLAEGQTEQAIELLETGLSIADQSEWIKDIRNKVLPEIYFSLAEAYARKDNYESVWANIERGLQLASKANELHQMAHAYQSMARIAIAEGRPDIEFEAYFEKSAELWRKLGALPDLGRLLIEAGEYMTEQKKLDRAATFFEEASEVFDGANLSDEAAAARARLA